MMNINYLLLSLLVLGTAMRAEASSPRQGEHGAVSTNDQTLSQDGQRRIEERLNRMERMMQHHHAGPEASTSPPERPAGQGSHTH